MPSRDWDDSWYDDDEFPPVRSNRGRGWIVAVAIVTFLMAALNALCASCLLLCGFVFAAINQANQNNMMLPGDLVQHAAVLLLGFGLTSGISFVLQIAAGIGLLNGRRWSRTLSFYLAGYSVLLSAFLGYLVTAVLANPMVDPDERVGQILLWGIGLICHAGYSLLVFLALLNGRIASSLR